MEFIPQFEPWLGEEEKGLLCKCVDDNWITGGPMVREFERRIAELCEVDHAIACSNGTMALYMALKACGIGEGDEVIVPDFTFIASANAVVLAGARPVFVDIDRSDLNISLEGLIRATNKHTKAIMPVHIYGRPADMYAIKAFTSKNHIKLIEDAAQGIGVKYDAKPVGGFGDANAISFYADKTMTTGEGGMVLADSQHVADNCMYLKHQGRLSRGVYVHEQIGYNFRLTDLQAAVGLAQLIRLPKIIEGKKRVDAIYRDKLADIVEFPLNRDTDTIVPFRMVVLCDNPGGLASYLKDNNVGSGRVFYPLHKQPCYSYISLDDKDYPNSIWAYEHGLALPSSAQLTDSQVEYVCDIVRLFVNHEHIKGKLRD